MIDEAERLVIARETIMDTTGRSLNHRKVITFISVLAAVLVGGVETLGLPVDQLKLEGPFWDFVGQVNDNFGLLWATASSASSPWAGWRP